MGKGQPSAVKVGSYSVYRLSVEKIPVNGISDVGKVKPYLVRSSRYGKGSYKGVFFVFSCEVKLVLRDGTLAFR
jgi:hypothetical protein